MATGSEIEYDPEFGIAMLNDSDVSSDDIRQAILDQAPEVAVLRRWALGNQSSKRTIFDRDKYVRPDTIFDKFRLAQEAAETDDVVSNVIETTEQLAFKRIAIECEDEDEENIWFQIADDINLPERMRECWRELFTISQAYPAVLFERKTLKVKGKSRKGTRRKKEFKNLLVPAGITLLDPLKVIPVGNFMFNKEQLVYIADIEEAARFDETLAGANSSDLIISQLITGKYTIPDDQRGRAELQKLQEITGRSDLRDRLFTLNPDTCWRITATRPQYKRFAHVRMESVFELLDLKHLLREMDRALLLGSTNAIILVKKGDKDRPAKQHEINQLTDYIKTTSRIPIIVSDHRIEIEIITPKNDKILATERYNGLDSRITSRLYQILSSGNYCVSPDTEILTKSGWKSYDCLEVGEMVYSVDPESGLGHWTAVEAVNVFDYTGPMLSMESHAHSSLSTPNHRWWVETTTTGRRKEMRWKTSEQLSLADRIPIKAPFGDFPVKPTHSDALVELAAWFWCEGHRMTDAPRRVQISQSDSANSEHCSSIRKLLTELYGPEGRVADGGYWYQDEAKMKFYLSAMVTEPLLNLFEDNQAWGQPTAPKRPTLEFLFSLTRSQMERLVHICLCGDGHIESSGRRRWHQKDLDSVDLLEMCCILLGQPCRNRLEPSRSEAGVVTFEFLKRDFTHPHAAAYSARRRGCDSASVSWVDYAGKVWCPTTKYGTWLARRNGKIFVTGNSSGTATDDSIKLLRVIASSMEARRDQIRDSIMTHVFRPAYLKNDQFTTEPKMAFYPRRIALDFDNNIATFIQTLRDRGDISRETILAELDIIQEDEAYKRQREAEKFDPIFKPTNVPFDSPNKGGPGGPTDNQGPTQKDGVTPKSGDPKTDGRTGGGNKNGGGRNPESTRPNPSKT